ncbi:hypothetical protein Trydic_g7405 [Trypoxylus dichotomus]
MCRKFAVVKQRKTQEINFWRSNDMASTKNHVDDCYFCLVGTSGYKTKNENKIVYLNIESAFRPVPHSDAHASLCLYLSTRDATDYQDSNVNSDNKYMISND